VDLEAAEESWSRGLLRCRGEIGSMKGAVAELGEHGLEACSGEGERTRRCVWSLGEIPVARCRSLGSQSNWVLWACDFAGDLGSGSKPGCRERIGGCCDYVVIAGCGDWWNGYGEELQVRVTVVIKGGRGA
jgi:hypothetical protein